MKTGFLPHLFPRPGPGPGEIRERKQAAETFSAACQGGAIGTVAARRLFLFFLKFEVILVSETLGGIEQLNDFLQTLADHDGFIGREMEYAARLFALIGLHP
jgi:hypothetical protein